uniref:Ubiquitin-ribosomal protein eL40 fusion protein n=1 Tax=Euglena gracilis TaxID=3039 RepID=A0A7L5NVL6_EUGGR|nr:60S large subunit ribosomal protein eL40 [Euglena gracilis]6ZJ3_L2 Chain L2, Ribosomal protein eL40 [Euglena gracilis]
MQVKVQTLVGRVLQIDLEEGASIDALKAKIEEEISLPSESQALFMDGKELDGESAEYKLDAATIHVVARLRGGVMMEPTLQALARKYNCEKMVCRKCYARLPLRSHNCRSKMCGHTSELRMKKKLK